MKTTLFVWSPKFELGFDDVDAQHKKLMGIANSLHEAQTDSKDLELVNSLLIELASYAKEHFDYEMRLLERQGYTDIAKHQRSHTAISNKISEYIGKASFHQAQTNYEMLSVIRHLLISDFLNIDKVAFDSIRTSWNKAA